MQLPKGKNLYDILDLTKKQVDHDESLVKKAYRKLALKYHPDKQSSSSSTDQTEQTTQQFLLVGYAYSILSDSAKRNHYDMTGGHGDLDSFFTDGKDWTNYFKQQWQGVVNGETIDAHAAKYRGSAEEEEDVLQYYTQFKGNMNHILAHVEHSKATDVSRYINWIQAAIKNNEVDTFPAYAKTTTKAAQMRRLKREEDEAARAEMEELKKQQAKNNHGKQKKGDQGDSNHPSDDIESSEAEEQTNDDDDVDDDGADADDDEDITSESLEDIIHARQRQRASKFDEMIANMEETATTASKGRRAAATTRSQKSSRGSSSSSKNKGKGRATANFNPEEDHSSTTSNDRAPTEPLVSTSVSPSEWAPNSTSTSPSTSLTNDDKCKEFSVSSPSRNGDDLKDSSVSTLSSNDDSLKNSGLKERQSITTINTRSTTKKQTQEIRTNAINVDADADVTTSTTSVVRKSKKITKIKQTKRKRGSHQSGAGNNDDNPTMAETKKAKRVSPSKSGEVDLSTKSSQRQTRSRRGKSAKST